jgi:uncharacterized membrane protein
VLYRRKMTLLTLTYIAIGFSLLSLWAGSEHQTGDLLALLGGCLSLLTAALFAKIVLRNEPTRRG